MTHSTTNFGAVAERLPEPEDIFLGLWGGRSAQAVTLGPATKGAFVYTPHVVVSPAVGGGHRPVLIELRDAPGPAAFYPKGTTKVRFTAAYRTGSTTHWRASGHFHIGVGVPLDDLPAPTVKITVEKGSKVAAPDRSAFPGNVVVPVVGPIGLRRQLAEACRIAADAGNRLTKERQVLWGLRQVKDKARGRYAEGTGTFDLDDTAQEYFRQVMEEAERYASYHRHNAVWSQVVKTNCVREPYRRYLGTRFEPQIINEIRHWIDAVGVPRNSDPDDVRKIKAQHVAASKWMKKHPDATLTEALAAVGDVPASLCRWSEDQIRRALQNPTVFASIDQPTGDGDTLFRDSIVGDTDVDYPIMESITVMADALCLNVEEVVALALARGDFAAEDFPPEVVAKAERIARRQGNEAESAPRRRIAAIADRVTAEMGRERTLATVTRARGDAGAAYLPIDEIASRVRATRLF